MPGSSPAAAAVNGFLNFYKPVGITSMGALRRVKRITGQRKKVGHAGTMDPLAEGVLPVCFGQATRLMEQVVSGRKQYKMTVRLGAASATYDAEGEITPVANPAGIAIANIQSALEPFLGEIDQLPPMYSALKVDGQRLYDLARAGKEIERRPRPVTIHAISIDALDLPDVQLTVDCGKGTYMRSLAHDLGQSLGCGGYVTALARTYCGGFQATDSITLDALEDAADRWQELIHPVDWALRAVPALALTPAAAQGVRNGQSFAATDTDAHNIAANSIAAGEQRRAYDPDGAFLALVQFDPGPRAWQPIRVFRSAGPSPYAPPPA